MIFMPNCTGNDNYMGQFDLKGKSTLSWKTKQQQNNTVLDCLKKKITIPQKFQFLFLIQEADSTFTFLTLIHFNQTA